MTTEQFETLAQDALLQMHKEQRQGRMILGVVLEKNANPLVSRFGEHKGKKIQRAKVVTLAAWVMDGGRPELIVKNECSMVTEEFWMLHAELLDVQRAQLAFEKGIPFPARMYWVTRHSERGAMPKERQAAFAVLRELYTAIAGSTKYPKAAERARHELALLEKSEAIWAEAERELYGEVAA